MFEKKKLLNKLKLIIKRNNNNKQLCGNSVKIINVIYSCIL